ncbi:hypothetical protein [Geodermatophilus sp. DSM 45219]|uniref:hypothetical protein n=1 Tax=Geodermatophilus sp. DSM 45219 TaxID=1881103 RepID=UPI000ABD11D2
MVRAPRPGRRAHRPRDPRRHRPRLLDHLADHRIPLEVCPTSNVRTGAVDNIEAHPLPAATAGRRPGGTQFR